MASPSLAVLRQGQKFVDELLVLVRRRIAGVRLDFVVGGLEANQIDIGAANQRAIVGLWRRRQPFLGQPGVHKVIELRPRRRRVRRDRLRKYVHRLECPPLPALLELGVIDDAPLCDGGGRCADTRIRRAAGNPRFEIGNHLVRELAAGWHLQMGIRVLHRVNQFAVGGFPGHQRGAECAPLHDAFTAVEREIAFRLLHRAVVTGVALGREHGPDSGLEKFVRDGLLRARVAGSQDHQQRADKNVPVHGHETSSEKTTLKTDE